MKTITSRHNPVFKSLLAAKADKNLMLLEGRRLVEDAFARGIQPSKVALTPEYAEAFGPVIFPYMLLSGQLFSLLAETTTPQGILIFAEIPWSSLADMKKNEKVIILDGIQDPGNVGTIIRTAEAFGYDMLAITPGTASPFCAKAIRASMGSCLGVKIVRATPYELKSIDHTIISVVPDGTSKLEPDLFRGRVAVCFGQEGRGISTEVLNISGHTVRVPMKGPTESLNVAVTAGIVLAYAAQVIQG
ncbi:MAG: RNA methyltransferase [Deltaproteobacteria bacterium]|nr:RNA methyltransferase [Deltaproteobacteria bacterium]